MYSNADLEVQIVTAYLNPGTNFIMTIDISIFCLDLQYWIFDWINGTLKIIHQSWFEDTMIYFVTKGIRILSPRDIRRILPTAR